eukprot:TRINITY_DN9848_c0_g2_i3.p1 TRINITY_DN9848_c0_g2~~TRINITY_DN9848_c0_g2_i3.p1  ORF type:complete len:474 (+),score=62.07 TRINITY_DN9848_c0_g2_i3:108-1529(+)
MEFLSKVGHKTPMELLTKVTSKLKDALPTKPQPRQRGEPQTDVFDELRELAFQYSWDEICEATDNFSDTKRLGEGAMGAVFRGHLREGTEVAVKLIEAQVGGGFEEEVRLLSRCRHPNVVMLLGFAQAPTAAGTGCRSSRRALVYELLRGGDLHARLQGKGRFSWRERLQAAIDVARGLSHLHKHRPEIFHRDIKSANILFGLDDSARIADFGLACISKHDIVRELAVDVASGTAGYADPLYAQTGVVNESNEIYSMGMVLIELLTGRPPALVKPNGDYVWFVAELMPYQPGAKQRLINALDPRARWPHTTATTLVNMALLCICQDADQRPSFIELATFLQELRGYSEASIPEANQTLSGRPPMPMKESHGTSYEQLQAVGRCFAGHGQASVVSPADAAAGQTLQLSGRQPHFQHHEFGMTPCLQPYVATPGLPAAAMPAPGPAGAYLWQPRVVQITQQPTVHAGYLHPAQFK